MVHTLETAATLATRQKSQATRPFEFFGSVPISYCSNLFFIIPRDVGFFFYAHGKGHIDIENMDATGWGNIAV